MSLRIRGAETVVRFKSGDTQLSGSFFKLESFEVTPRQDLKEDPFLGELEDDLDFMQHGWDFTFTIQYQDSQAIDFVERNVLLDRSHRGQDEITMTVIFTFRDGSPSKVVVYYGCFIKQDSENMASRKEYVKGKFSGKAKRRTVSIQA